MGAGAVTGDTAVRAAALRTRLIVLLSLAGIINYADRQIIAILKPLIEHSVGWTDATYGSIIAAFQLATAIACLFAGSLVDRLGLKWANPLSVGSFSVVSAAHALARTSAEFVLARAGLGVTEALATPAVIKTVGECFEPEPRARALGWINASNSVGAILTPLIVPAVAVALGWRAAFAAVGAVGLLWTAAWLWLMRSFDSGARAPALPAGAAVRRYLRLLAERRTWAILGAKALIDQVWWLLLFWTPDFLHRDFHLSVRALGVPVAAIYTAAIIGSVGGGSASSRLISRGMRVVRARLAVMLACSALAFALFAVTGVHWLWAAVAALGLGIVAHQGFSVNLFALITDVVEPERVGTITSLGALSGNLAGMAVVWLLGVHLTAGGSYTPFLGFAAISYALALLWLRILLPRAVRAA
ncbi:MAG: MFS transporter [Gammaproteobacteria bacterium]|nr:MFS transporter [Gammaproteobacteria bacterium]